MKFITCARLRLLISWAASLAIFSLASGLAAGLAKTNPGHNEHGIRASRAVTENGSQERQTTEARPELVLQTGYSGSVSPTRLVFSPDGRLLATATAGTDTIKLWETATGRELRNLTSAGRTAPDVVPLVDFSPNSRVVAVASGSNPIQIWHVTTGSKLQTLSASQGSTRVSFLAYNAQGTVLVAISDKIRLWDVHNWRELHSYETSGLAIAANEERVAISPDGRQLAFVVNSGNGTHIKLLDLTNGREVSSANLPIEPAKNSVLSFTLDGRLLVSAIVDHQLQLWDVLANEREYQLGRVKQEDGLLRFSRDGRVLAYSEGEKVKVWDAAKGDELAVLKVPRLDGIAPGTIHVGLSDDGNRVATSSVGTPTMLWDTKVEKPLLKLSGRTNQAFKVSFSADGNRLTSGGRTRWDLRTGRGQRIVNGSVGERLGVSSPDEKLFATFENNTNVVTILQTPAGRVLHTLAPTPNPGFVKNTRFSRDGDLLLTIYGGKSGSQVKIWEVKSGRELQTMIPGDTVIDAAFNRDGQAVAVLSDSGQLSFWEVASGNKLRVLGDDGPKVTSFAFGPDEWTLAMGQTLPNAEGVGHIVVLDWVNSRELGRFGSKGAVNTVAFSRDGRLLASSSSENTITIWDIAKGEELRTLTGHSAHINSIDFSPDLRLLATASDDGATFLWDMRTGEHLLNLVSLDDGAEWVAVTPQGIFDGTPVSWNQILWRYDHDTFNVAPIEWFFNEFYYPGLLADVFFGKRPRVAEDVAKKDRRQPLVKLSLVGVPVSETGITSRRVKVRIEVTDAPPDRDNAVGTGAYDLRLFRNGSLVKFWRGDILKRQGTVKLEEEITVAAGANRLTAYAFNRDNVKSKDAQLSLMGSQGLRRAGTAYIIAVGVNEYENPQYNLKYAVADAQEFSEELRRKLTQLSRFDRVEIVSLINEQATKANIKLALKRLSDTNKSSVPISGISAIDRLKRAAPEDAVIIYFAGHGTAQGQRFYLIPHDLGYRGQRAELDGPGLQTILSHSISDVELEQEVEDFDAGHLLLFIDACNSGQALEAEEKRRGPMNSKGLAQLAYEKGMYVLTASQSYQAALEAAHLGNGLLTYVLVEEGLKTDVADAEPRDGVLSAREWLDFATERVPEMQQEKMQESRGIGLELAFVEGEQDVPPAQRNVQRPRVFYRRELETSPLVISRSATATSDITAGGRVANNELSRWFDLQTAMLGIRYRYISNSADITVSNHAQYITQFRGRFKFDRPGNYSINAGVFTGNTFNGGFNDTGIGTGEPITNLYLKQLYFSAKPVRGVEVQFGGLYFNRGESTEITSYDNDGYLMGERLVIQRPENLFFDEISVTYAFLGDLLKPNINKRWHGLGRSNYHQFLIGKKIGERAVFSGDYTFETGRDTFRQAVRVNTPELNLIDFFRLELYQRAEANPKAGLAAYAEKAFLKKRLTIGGGYAQIDPRYGGLNADRFNFGRRFFFNGSYRLSDEFTISTFYTRAFQNDLPITNRTRFEILFNYNLLKTLQKAGIF